MIKRIQINKKIMLLIILIILLAIAYYIYNKNNTYEEFEENLNFEEVDTYEHEKIDYSQKEGEAEIENIEQNVESIIVHITGEVKNWGVIELKKGARIIDAVNMAGGFTDEADTEKINLAYELTDGVKVYIPSKNEKVENTTNTQKYITTDGGDNVVGEENAIKKSNNLLVNINEATQTELETLPGIGPSIALKIISYREENGRFLNIDDIKNVPGIGDSKFENIRNLICL